MNGAGRSIGFEWAAATVPLVVVVLAGAVLLRVARRHGGEKPALGALGPYLTRRTGLPGWAVATVGTGVVAQALTVAAVYWDVAWHVNLGRDRTQVTPAHVLILGALALIVVAGLAGVVVANLAGPDGAHPGRLRWRNLSLPWSAVLVGLGGVAAFGGMPLDDLWHRNYGVDLTMWSPTHLLMIAGGNLGALGLWLVLGEAQVRPADGRRVGLWPHPRWGWLAHFAVAGCVFAQLHIFQGEFDFGVPLFQLLYQPVLTIAAAGVVLVAARLVLGRGGALAVALAYLVFRAGMAAVVGAGLDHTAPYVPFHLASATGVEAVALLLGTVHRLRFAAASALVLATAGLAGERIWVDVVAPHPWGRGLVPDLFLVGGVAAAGAVVLGTALGGFAAGRAPLPAPVLALGAVAMLVALVLPLPRTVSPVRAGLHLDRDGDGAVVTVRLDPPGAADDARWFEAFAWQGGGLVRAELEEVGPGTWRSRSAVPVTGRWKTVVRLHRGSDLVAFPVYAPADPAIGAPAVPAADRAVLARGDSDVLLREVHRGPAWPAAVAWTGIAAAVAAGCLVVRSAVGGRRGRRLSTAGDRPPGAVGPDPATASR